MTSEERKELVKRAWTILSGDRAYHRGDRTRTRRSYVDIRGHDGTPDITVESTGDRADVINIYVGMLAVAKVGPNHSWWDCPNPNYEIHALEVLRREMLLDDLAAV